ncbi:uncharacterized protein A1O9_11377 [Exophiala aquamarina CBS 119918]|uniref:Peptidase A1 domain-containing protein n=1 Tax=Exophiala aquamarina CBS 119918 TaxID=1182545 RepID=A0A072PAB7_9EURO|nr:uncharacterized protein A1O9_11377 [Exophiala aquamarina CBS 119918]KEF52535.1 hypothetical protein A1O9_11377 [Exophiala aquamarina CBS 119918]
MLSPSMRPSLLLMTCILAPTTLTAGVPKRSISLPLNRRDKSGSSSINGTSLLTATNFGSVFDTNVTFGDQTFQVFIDTGSSDTWVVRNDFTCFDRTSGLKLPQKSCNYGPASYDPINSASYELIPDEIFGIQYGDGMSSGVMAYENITLAGLSIRQKVGIINASSPMGDGVNVGVLGLGYPSLTSAHPGPSQDNETFWYNRLPYEPLIFNMSEQGLIDPYFSLAIARTSQNETIGFGGYLTLGGLAPANHSDKWATVPVEIHETIPANFTSGERVISYWTTTVNGFRYGPATPVGGGSQNDAKNLTTDDTRFQVFFDNGNYLTFLPEKIVAPINALFDPPAIWNDELSIYVVQCDAVAPAFGITLDNQTFFHDGRDLVYQTEAGICISNLVPSETISIGDITLHIIGAGFYKNVLSVFDFGKNEMRFASLLGEVVVGHDSNQSTGDTTAPAQRNAASSVAASIILVSGLVAGLLSLMLAC